jgi:hypothetical protein
MTTTRLDRRLVINGLCVTVADLVAVYLDHHPGQAATCGMCQHRYTSVAPLCPSMTLARTLLLRRSAEDPIAFEPIAKDIRRRDTRHLPSPAPAPVADVELVTADLFPIDPTWRADAPRRARRDAA